MSISNKNDVQFCGKCGSTNIQESKLNPLGDPFRISAFSGWDCLDCGHTGQDFFIVSKDEYKKILKEKFHKKVKD